ncbi:MAG: FAD-dependent oxidoreductase, partial [Nitrospinota bacterium]|nr:FAD-dependent oxidoreductase [Nitrospinota bacterium]
MEKVDGIVIGAGHNGLITAAYLARAGLRMLVIERNPEIGGGATTDEVTLPGFRSNLHANFHFGCVDSPWFRDLELQRYGFSYILPQAMIAMTYPDGTCMTLHQDPEKTAASIARISKVDAESFRELHEMFSVKMRPFILSAAFS